MAVFATNIAIDAWLDEAWTDIKADVIGNISYFYGIRGSSPIDRVASPGWMRFSLNNRSQNPDQSWEEGRYVPGHANCRTDFAIGLPVRLRIVYDGVARFKWYGTICADGIEVEKTPQGVSKTNVKAVDFIDQSARHEMVSPDFAVDQKIEDIVALILDNMVIQPQDTSYGLGSETFEAVFDTVTEKTRALTEFAKVAISEFGYIYTRRDEGSANIDMEVLETEGRSTRILYRFEPELIPTESGNVPADFDNTFISLHAPYASQLYNRISMRVLQRKVDTTSTVVLFSTPSAQPILVPASSSFQFVARYEDLNDLAREVYGTDMQTMVSGTDWIANDNITLTGTDRTANVTCTTPYGFGANDATVNIRNDHTGDVYVFVQLRGKGVYIYEPTNTVFEDDTSIALVGPRPLNIDMKYSTDPATILGIGEQLLANHKDAYIMPERVDFIANRSDKLMASWINLEPGQRIHLKADAQAIDDDYFIQGCFAEIQPKGLVKFGYHLTDAVDEMYDVFDAELLATGINGLNATYATARSTSAGFSSDITFINLGQALQGGSYYVMRMFLKFDTSAIPDAATITSVKLRMTVKDDDDDTAFNIQVMTQDWSAQDPIAAGNREAAYDACLAIGTGATTTKLWATSSSLVANVPYTGSELPIDWVDKTGTTYLSVRSNKDKSNTAPSGAEFLSFYTSEEPNSKYRPQLVITYSQEADTPDVFIIAGQSNASGRGTNNQEYEQPSSSLHAYLFGNDYVYKELYDPTDDNTNQVDTVSEDTGAWKGSCWPLLATEILAATGRRVIFVPCAKGSTEINDWLPGTDHQDRSTLYGSMVYRALQAANYGTLRGVLWYQGEANVALGTGGPTYNARLDTIADALEVDLGIPILPAQLHLIDGEDCSTINGAITDAIADNDNVLAGADMHLFAPDGDLHYNSDADLEALADGWWTALQAAFGW